MATVTAYWRPASIAEALELLDRRGTVVLGGGTTLHDVAGTMPVEVVDLQALRLDGVDAGPDHSLVLGATTTLQQVADDEQAPDIVREAARRERPSTLRGQATIGGCVARGDRESELLATLLVHEAVVRIGRTGAIDELPLGVVLGELPIAAGRLVLAVRIRTGGVAAVARTGRTPADRPIVAAVARRTDDGSRWTALTVVASTPILATGTDDLDPPGDFRGSGEYRRALAETLLARVVEAVA